MVLELLRPSLPVPAAAIRRGLSGVCLAGRCQRLTGTVETVLDVAHNPHSAAALLANLQARPCRGRTHVVLAMLEDKDVGACTEILAPVADAWYLAALEVERGLAVEDLHRRISPSIPPQRVRSFPDVQGALQQAGADSQDGDRIVVCGSFHTVAAAMASRV
jgi:dihydrofolate synthase/folylpolyglutamate synthase